MGALDAWHDYYFGSSVPFYEESSPGACGRWCDYVQYELIGKLKYCPSKKKWPCKVRARRVSFVCPRWGPDKIPHHAIRVEVKCPGKAPLVFYIDNGWSGGNDGIFLPGGGPSGYTEVEGLTDIE